MTRPATLTLRHTLQEGPSGWGHLEWGETYHSASAARRAMDAHERRATERGLGVVVSYREWRPVTETGRRIVAALQEVAQ